MRHQSGLCAGTCLSLNLECGSAIGRLAAGVLSAEDGGAANDDETCAAAALGQRGGQTVMWTASSPVAPSGDSTVSPHAARVDFRMSQNRSN